MANTGTGNAPFSSTWLNRTSFFSVAKTAYRSNPLVRSLAPGGNSTMSEEVWTDFFFEAAPAAPGGTSVVIWF